MGLFAFGLQCLLIAGIGMILIWLRRKFVSAEFAIFDTIIIVLCIIMMLYLLAGALGIMGYDPKIPKIGG